MIRLIYLHGFNSSPQTIKGRQLAASLAPLADPIAFDLPALPHRPGEAIALVERLLAQHAADDHGSSASPAIYGGVSETKRERGAAGPAQARGDDAPPFHGGRNHITLIGSSLGGYYATFLAEKHGLKAVLINPAVLPDRDLEQFLGPQRNLYTGEPYELTPAHLAEMRALSVPRITRPERYYLLVQTGDEVLDYREAVRYYAGAKQCVIEGGDHGFHDFEREIPEILRFAGWPAASL